MANDVTCDPIPLARLSVLDAGAVSDLLAQLATLRRATIAIPDAYDAFTEVLGAMRRAVFNGDDLVVLARAVRRWDAAEDVERRYVPDPDADV